MRLSYLRVDRALSCGGLLDGTTFAIEGLRQDAPLAPLCLIGPNGSGKSQLLQLIAEIFQAAWNQFAPAEERESSNSEALFELRYQLATPSGEERTVKISRKRVGRRTGAINMAVFDVGEWRAIEPHNVQFGENLPSLVVGYTSGDNETLSLPFFVSRSGYAKDVREAALPAKDGMPDRRGGVPDNRLLLIDYSTHLEVLVANLLLGSIPTREAVISHANLTDLASFRCIIQLNHAAAPDAPKGAPPHRKGLQLTAELEEYIDAFRRASTCWRYDERHEIYTFDFFVDDACRAAFREFFGSSIEVYKAFHKLSLLNDLAIPKPARDRLKKELKTRRFASRLPEPQDEDKVFRFEQVSFSRQPDGGERSLLDYVSLSDGEHQFSQILGVFAMIESSNALFVLDEPESHFNPKWRVQFTKMLLGIPSETRGQQEILLTTHAPFVPCDLPREQVLIFAKDDDGALTITSPSVETFGSSFDRILSACFEIRPPISQVARDTIRILLETGSVEEIKEALEHLGPSVEKSFLADRVRQLSAGQA